MAEVRSIILAHPQFQQFRNKVETLFGKWQQAVMPLFTGIQLSLIYAWLATLGAEYLLASGKGLGNTLIDGREHFWMDLVLFGVVVIGALAEVMSKTLDLGLEGTGAPPVITAIVVAAISAAPEILTALRAALANRMQSVVNIALGASLSTVILTVPVMEAMALYTGQPFQMAMTPVQTVMVLITLIVSAINLNDGETNAIEGMTHFVLFATFIMLSLLGL